MTIKYTEKGQGLHTAIQATGHALWQVDGEWVSTNDVAVQAIIDGYTLEEAARHKKAQVSAHGTMLRNKVVAGYSPGELASWSIKLTEASAYTNSGGTASTPLLSIEASLRGVSTADLVKRVLDNGSMFSTMEAAIAGREGFHRDKLDACTTFDEIAAYDISADWPEF